MEKKNSWSSGWGKIGLLIILVIASFIAWSIFKQMAKEKEIQKEISKLQSEASRISQENTLTREKIAYFESREYKERKAKERLNLKSSEESVVIIKPGIIKKSEPANQEEESLITKSIEVENNYIKWWVYFTRH